MRLSTLFACLFLSISPVLADATGDVPGYEARTGEASVEVETEDLTAEGDVYDLYEAKSALANKAKAALSEKCTATALMSGGSTCRASEGAVCNCESGCSCTAGETQCSCNCGGGDDRGLLERIKDIVT